MLKVPDYPGESPHGAVRPNLWASQGPPRRLCNGHWTTPRIPRITDWRARLSPGKNMELAARQKTSVVRLLLHSSLVLVVPGVVPRWWRHALHNAPRQTSTSWLPATCNGAKPCETCCGSSANQSNVKLKKWRILKFVSYVQIRLIRCVIM